jgi:hypothetical protein
MLDQFQHLYKYRIQFSSDTKIGYVNVTTMGNKNDAINLFLKHCRLQHPVVIDCKFLSIVIDKGGGGQIGTLTFEVNDEIVGTFSGEDKVIDINVPNKMSQLVNDSSYITRDELTDELVEEIKQDIEKELGGKIETSQNKVQFITEEGSEIEYPSTKAIIDYISRHTITEEEINEIINSNS